MSHNRNFLFAFLLILTGSSPVAAHRAEPISTEFALPFQPKAGNGKIIYEFEREGRGAHEQAIPELELELGIAPRWQINLGFPVLRVKEAPGEPAHTGGGKLELGARYLLFGGAARRYAVSLQGIVEAPTGNSALVGDATEVGVGLFAERYFGERVRLHSNLSWKTTVGGAQEVERVFEYNHAVVWFATLRWIPVLELLGKTDTATGQTQLAVQPEVIFYGGPHFELKVGLPVGLTAAAPDVGLRAQVAIIWGGPR